jgi:thiamine biosynthesis lipoprotein
VAACSAPPAAPTTWTRSEVVFGTIPANLTVVGPEDDALFQGYIDLLNTVDKEMSMWDRPYVTDVMRLAEAAGNHAVEVSPDTLFVLQRALDIGTATDGALDVAIGPLVKLWGVATDHPKVPSQKQIDALLPLISRQDIVLKDSQVFLRKKGMIVDVGGIAKGFAADKAVEYLRAKGVTSAIVDLGGNVYVIGGKPDGKGGTRPWRIGIQDPYLERGAVLGTVSATDISLVTSGVYERKFTDPATGKVYHHILDPKTGWPTDNGLVSVTVVNKSSIDCDGYAKVIVLGLKRGWEVLQAHHLEGIFVTADKKVYVTPGLAKDFTLKAADYQLADLP